ncbi:MAG: helix-turn-helix transcriptional regulator [Clostridiaceae bacterium]|nr:helix-turn-helix transcriptional regulator [Clostridiaceae bacterium]
MINKIHFGKRIAAHRKELHLSQAELSEELSVTSQAVSKWECGTALPDLDLLLELSHMYGVTINQLLEDSDIVATLADRKYEYDGIAYFVPRVEAEHNKQWVEGIVNGDWIARNFSSSKLKKHGAR